MRNFSYSCMLILLNLHRSIGHGLKTCMWFGYNPQIRFYHFFRHFNFIFFFQALVLSTYVDSMYLVWINPPINFTFSDDSVFLKKILEGDINSLNLLVYLRYFLLMQKAITAHEYIRIYIHNHIQDSKLNT